MPKPSPDMISKADVRQAVDKMVTVGCSPWWTAEINDWGVDSNCETEADAAELAEQMRDEICCLLGVARD